MKSKLIKFYQWIIGLFIEETKIKAEVIGDHVALKRILPTEDENSVGGFEYSTKDANDMRIHSGEIMGFGSLCDDHLEVGKTAYYDKSRSYVIRLLDGEEYTMIKLNAIVAIE